MKKKKKETEESRAWGRLRKRAENALRDTGSDDKATRNMLDMLLHELQVHEVELQMQNDELRSSNVIVEESRQKFASLYDLAPVAYFTIDSFGIIHEVNYTACKLLELEKRKILKRRFQAFVSKEDHQVFYNLLHRIINTRQRQLSELWFSNTKGHYFYGSVQAIAIDDSAGGRPLCYVTVADITERYRLEQASMSQKMEQQKEVLTAIVQTQENERTRISESLHDSVAQLLYASKLHLGEMQTADPLKAKIEDLLNRAIRKVRNISFELSPAVLRDFGLITALEELVKLLATPSLKIMLRAQGMHERLPERTELTVYRIVQETLNNAIKHSQAAEVIMEVSRNGDELSINITDNGIGFSVDEMQSSSKGMGLISIRNRLHLLNGELNISSQPGKGTAINIKISV